MSQMLSAQSISKGGVCRKCRHDLRVKLKGPGERYQHTGTMCERGESDGAVYCSNQACPFFDTAYKPGHDVNRGGLKLQDTAMLAALSRALGPIQAGGIQAN